MNMNGYLAFNLTDSSRETLLAHFNPVYKNVIAHHVTYKFNTTHDDEMPDIFAVKVVGYSINNEIECVVVEVAGEIIREDGRLFHITLSHKDGVKPFQSNVLLSKDGFISTKELSLEVIPSFNPF